MAPEPNPTGPTPDESEPPAARPDLYLVEDADVELNPTEPAAEEPDLQANETATDLTDDSQPDDAGGAAAAPEQTVLWERAVTPQAPLDQRALEAISEVIAQRPRWNEPPPSFAQIWQYSTSGDWTTDDNSARRVGHSLLVLITLGVTFPVRWATNVVEDKPIAFVVAAVLVALVLLAL